MNTTREPVSRPATEPGPRARTRVETPARLFVGRAGAGYLTRTQLRLRQDHAVAMDAVQAELRLREDLGATLVTEWALYEISTQASSKAEYLLRPDLGRQLSRTGRDQIIRRCPVGVDLQIIIGDGLSAAAVKAQVPRLLGPLATGAHRRGWRFGQPFVVRYCRVGVLNEIGEILDPAVVILLIGERPGLRTADSLSAYMAYRPRAGHTDAERNLISNIHRAGIHPAEAVGRIFRLANELRERKLSGVAV